LILMEKRIKSPQLMFPMENDEVLTTYEASKYLNISKPTYFKLIRLGKIEAVKVGNSWRVLRSGLYRFLTGAKKR
jgi:excisionase family DNA binding protein